MGDNNLCMTRSILCDWTHSFKLLLNKEADRSIFAVTPSLCCLVYLMVHI